MKRRWWRRLAQQIAYPRKWPRCISFWLPVGSEMVPPQMQIDFDGHVATYVLLEQQR